MDVFLWIGQSGRGDCEKLNLREPVSVARASSARNWKRLPRLMVHWLARLAITSTPLQSPLQGTLVSTCHFICQSTFPSKTTHASPTARPGALGSLRRIDYEVDFELTH